MWKIMFSGTFSFHVKKLKCGLDFIPGHFTHPAFCPPGRVPVPLSPARAVVEPRRGSGAGHVLCDAMVDATTRTCNGWALVMASFGFILRGYRRDKAALRSSTNKRNGYRVTIHNGKNLQLTKFRQFQQLLGYCSYQLPRQDDGTYQIQVNGRYLPL